MDKETILAIKKRFLAELPGTYGEKAVENFEKFPKYDDFEADEYSIITLLAYSFEWAKTPEGTQFWSTVYHVMTYDKAEGLEKIVKGFEWFGWEVVIYPDFFRVGCQKFTWEDLEKAQRVIRRKSEKEEINEKEVRLEQDSFRYGFRWVNIGMVKEFIKEIKKFKPKKKTEIIA